MLWIMYIAYLLPNMCWFFILWCGNDTTYYVDPDFEAILEDPQCGEEYELRELSADDVA